VLRAHLLQHLLLLLLLLLLLYSACSKWCNNIIVAGLAGMLCNCHPSTAAPCQTLRVGALMVVAAAAMVAIFVSSRTCTPDTPWLTADTNVRTWQQQQQQRGLAG
jgi:hypothetical protein